MLGRVTVLVVSGFGIGIVAALALTRLFAGFLYGVAPSDPITYARVCVVLATAATVAAAGPARRAIRVDPLIAIRHD